MQQTFLRPAVQATLHCLLGCSIGEILGMIISTAFNLHNAVSIIVSIVLAFVFGYGLTIRSLVKHVSFKQALRLAFASDTVSITSMEIVDNLFIIIVPGALAATLVNALFWWSLAVSLIIAFTVTVPVNYWLLKRGRGHAVVAEYHNH